MGSDSNKSKKVGRTPYHKKRVYTSFGTYIHRVLKRQHKDFRITKRTVGVIDSLVNDLFGKIMHTAEEVRLKDGIGTIRAREIQTAVRLVYRGELAGHAVRYAQKALDVHVKNKSKV